MTNETSLSKSFIYLTVFLTGMATLAIELSASRLLGNVFGASNLVWANVIGLILLYLSVGYFIGGRWADRSPYFTTLFKIILWAAFLSGLVPLVARPVLQTAAQAVVGAEAALALGSFISVLILFSVPVTLLGCVSPFAIRLAIGEDGKDAGRISGQIYAISTVGSLIGTFLPTLLLIPNMGTVRTFLIFAALLYLIGFIGLGLAQDWTQAARWVWMPILVGLLAVWALNGYLRPPVEGSTVLYDAESGYNYIQVIETEDGYRDLLLNEGQGIHSRWHPEDVTFGGTWELFLAAPYFNPPPYQPQSVESLLVIGLAAGTIPRQYIEVYGDIPMAGVEIDPKIVEAGAQYFDMNAIEMPSLDVYVQDGRYVLNQLDETYSVIAIDAYRPPYIPWHMTTVEFFQEIQAHLTADGVVAINVGRTNQDRRLVDAMTHTMSQVFPAIHAIDVPRAFNTILVATNQPSEATNLEENLRLIDRESYPTLHTILTLANDNRVETGESTIVFYDDRAPVETLVDSLVLNFLLNGDLNEIR
jgi:spermidine synthase